MTRHLIADFLRSPHALAVVLGTNEIASAVAVQLTLAGYRVVLSDDPYPPVIRRKMSFHDALFGEPAMVEGVRGERAATLWDIASTLTRPRHVAVTPLHLTDVLALGAPDVLVDGRMQKHRVTPDYRGLTPVTVGLGPNFAVGVNCDVAVETRPARNGTIVRQGRTDAPDGLARSLGGHGKERFVYADRPGLWTTPLDIGRPVRCGAILGHLAGNPVAAPFDGVLRGLVRDGTPVPADVKLVEIDARAAAAWTGIDGRGRAIAEAAVQAIRLHAAGAGSDGASAA